MTGDKLSIVVGRRIGLGMVESGVWWGTKTPEKHEFWGSKKRVSGSPGRGVLRFWGGGIQESRSFFDQKRPKNQKSEQLRGWCNTTPGSLLFLGFLRVGVDGSTTHRHLTHTPHYAPTGWLLAAGVCLVCCCFRLAYCGAAY